MIAAVSTVRNEADIVASTIRHLLAEGVDLVLVADGQSSDGTKDILEALRKETHRLSWYVDSLPYHRQPFWINWLAAEAASRGAAWVIPFDADEYWIAPGRTLAEAINAQPEDVGVLCAPIFQHHDAEHRETTPKPFPKVAYRWCETARIRAGNHGVDGVPGREVWDVLQVREIQYRGFEHFVAKMRARNATIDPELPADAGWHHRRLADFTDQQLRAEWDAMCAVPTVHDPIR